MSFWREGTLRVSNIPREAYPVDVEEAIAEAYHAAIPMWIQRPDYVRHISASYYRVLCNIEIGFQSF